MQEVAKSSTREEFAETRAPCKDRLDLVVMEIRSHGQTKHVIGFSCLPADQRARMRRSVLPQGFAPKMSRFCINNLY